MKSKRRSHTSVGKRFLVFETCWYGYLGVDLEVIWGIMRHVPPSPIAVPAVSAVRQACYLRKYVPLCNNTPSKFTKLDWFITAYFTE